MGIYVNPTDGTTKEQFLKKYGTEITLEKFKSTTFLDASVKQINHCVYVKNQILFIHNKKTPTQRLNQYH